MLLKYVAFPEEVCACKTMLSKFGGEIQVLIIGTYFHYVIIDINFCNVDYVVTH